MPPTFYGAIDLVRNELRNAVVQNLGTAPATPVKGQLWMDSTANILKWYDGTQWINAMGAAGAVLADTVVTLAPGFATAGTATTVSRGDHAHGLPSWGTVTAETTFGGTSSNGAVQTFARSDHQHGNPTHLAADHSAISLSALAAPTGLLNLNGQRITALADPTVATDAVTLQYVQGLVSGLSWKAPVRAATTANITLSGTQTIDGVALAANDRVLVKNQTTASANGIYVVATGAWTRATDANSQATLVNAAVFVSSGTTQADTAWVMTTDPPITVGTTALSWVQFGAMASYVAGNGLNLTGNSFAVGAGTGIVVNPTNVAVDTTWLGTQITNALPANMTRKYAGALTGTVAYATGEVVTHNLNTRDVQVTVLNGASPYQAVEVDWEATTVNTVTLRYNPNLGAGYRVVVQG